MIKKIIRKKAVIRLLVFLWVMVVAGFQMNPISAKAASTTSTVGGTTNTSETTSADEASSSEQTVNDLKLGNNLNISYSNGNGEFSSTIQILLVLTLISLAPSLLIMLTSFTRIIIVLHFTRAALNTQTAPPNQVLIGLAVFLTIFIMSPIFNQINEAGIPPFNNGEITQE